MKKIILCNLFVLSLNISAQDYLKEILCSGATNDGALIELQIDLYSNQNLIKIEDESFNLATNNAFTIAWSNEVDDTRYDNLLSKINGNMIVIAVNQDSAESSIRANLSCVEKLDRVIQ